MPAVAGLPNSDPVARAHGERVDAHLRAAIAAAGGWIPFARFMDLALYACKLGAAGDFTTAPEMTPLFGVALAVQVAAILEATDAREIVELGAGTGRLAADLLNALARRDDVNGNRVQHLVGDDRAVDGRRKRSKPLDP
jgi:SAM-dependent MidA family methyltransferase